MHSNIQNCKFMSFMSILLVSIRFIFCCSWPHLFWIDFFESEVKKGEKFFLLPADYHRWQSVKILRLFTIVKHYDRLLDAHIIHQITKDKRSYIFRL